MINLAIAGRKYFCSGITTYAESPASEFLSISGCEAKQKGYFYGTVVGHIFKRIQAKFPDESIRVMYLCGSDHANYLCSKLLINLKFNFSRC